MYEPKQADFDFPDSDITISIKCGNTTISGRVSSAAMSLASPVWKKFICPPWQPSAQESESVSEAQSTTKRYPLGNVFVSEEPRIKFTEDDPEALRILLRIAHLQFTAVPAKLSAGVLFYIAALCDQYMCAKIVVPWLRGWIDSSRIRCCELSLGNPDFVPQKCLFVFYVFGLSKAFGGLAFQMVKHAKIKDGGLSFSDVRWHNIAPPGINESIKENRERTITAILRFPYQILDELENKATRSTVCADESCRALIYGSLVTALIDLKLWPRIDAKDVHKSCWHLRQELASMELLIKKGTSYDSCRSKRCALPRLDKEMLDQRYDPVLPSHEQHMRTVQDLIGDL